MKVEYISQAQPRKVEWPSDVVLELIDLWKSNKCLYDKSHRYYTNKNARFNAVKNIANSLHYRLPDLSPNDVNVKIHYLRGQYLRELVRQQKNNSINCTESDECGADEEPVSYKPTTYWFHKISFLRDFLTTKKRKLNDADMSSKILPYVCEFDSDPLDLLQQPSKSKDKRTRTRKYSGSTRNKSKKEENSDIPNESTDTEVKVDAVMVTTPTTYSETLSVEQLAAHTIHDRKSIIQRAHTDVDAFANHVKMEMHKITDEELQDEIQLKIENLLYEYKRKQRALNRQTQ